MKLTKQKVTSYPNYPPQIILRDEDYELVAECGSWDSIENQAMANKIVAAVNGRPALEARIIELEKAIGKLTP